MFQMAGASFLLHNPSHLLTQIGNLQSSYTSVKRALETFPEHFDSKELMKQLEQHFAAL